MPSWRQAILLTILGFLLIAAAVGLTMWYAVYHLGVDHAYWLVPILGAAGGTVGGLIRQVKGEGDEEESAQKASDEGAWYNFRLCSLEPPSSVNMGVLGDTVVGIGGATAAVFLFGGTLKFEPGKPETYVLLVSVSFIAGVVGKKMVETASKRLLNEARNVADKAGTNAARKVAKWQTEMAEGVWGFQAQQLSDAHKYSEALGVLDQLIKNSPTSTRAYVWKGRTLKRMGQIDKALEAVNQGLVMQPPRDVMCDLFYNRACYKNLAGFPLDDVLADLKKAISISEDPKLKDEAREDEDFKSIWNEKAFLDLVGSASSSQGVRSKLKCPVLVASEMSGC